MNSDRCMHAVIVKLIPNNQVGMNNGLSSLFFGHFEKNSRPKKLKPQKKLKQNIQKLNNLQTKNGLFAQKTLIYFAQKFAQTKF